MRRTLSVKKIITIVSLFTALIFTACGNSVGKTTENEELKSQDSLDKEQSNKDLGEFNKNATIDETVLFEESGVKIIATELTYGQYIELGLVVDNNSGKTLSFFADSCSVNGYMIQEGFWYCDATNGEKLNESISFDYDSLMKFGINEIADIEIGFRILDEEWNSKYSGPCKVQTSIYDTHDYEKDYYQDTIVSDAAMNTFAYEMIHFSKEKLYDESGIKLLSSGFVRNLEGNTSLLLEFENTTEKTISISANDIAYNGLIVDRQDDLTGLISPGKYCIVELPSFYSTFSSEFFEDYGIKDIASVSFSLIQESEDGTQITDAIPVKIDMPGKKYEFDKTGIEIYNSNGLRIIYKTIKEESSEYSSDRYILLIAENNSDETLEIRDVEESLLVNGTKSDYYYDWDTIKEGESIAFQIQLKESPQIDDIADIKEVEIGLEIIEDDTIIDEPVIKISINE